MQTATAERRSEKYADKRCLQSLDWTISGIAGTGNLSPRARRLLQLYVSIAKLAYCGIVAPLGAIGDTLRRVLDGGSCSVRTIQRAHKELINANFIFIYQRHDNFCRILFNPAAFSYWTGKKHENTTPLPTQSHSKLHTTNCHPEDRRNITSCVNLRNSSEQIKEHRAGARTINIKKKTPKNPVLFSLLCVLRKANLLHASDRRLARLRAQCEVDALGAGVELVNPSGVDWQYWARNWKEMSVPVRESTVCREILPNLIRRQPTEPEFIPTRPPIVEISEHEPTPPTETEIKQLLSALNLSIKQPADIPAALPPVSVPTPAPMQLTADDFAVLDAARRRVKGVYQ
ncbi:MAG: hypothetical protein A2Y72_07705 [Chloroflexi bacterium RBG_13_53_26]|nr:MAG: hypothetical protein A2Y72_07705 [Chloroflexi bacterium RBG_13_53_26]